MLLLYLIFSCSFVERLKIWFMRRSARPPGDRQERSADHSKDHWLSYNEMLQENDSLGFNNKPK